MIKYLLEFFLLYLPLRLLPICLVGYSISWWVGLGLGIVGLGWELDFKNKFLKKDIDRLGNQLENFESRAQERMDRQENFNHSTHQVNLETSLEQIQALIDHLSTHQVNLETSLEQIQALIDHLDDKVDNLTGDVLSLSDKIDDLKGKPEDSW